MALSHLVRSPQAYVHKSLRHAAQEILIQYLVLFGYSRYLCGSEPRGTGSMSKSAIGASYAHSFLWVVLFMAVTVGVSSIAHLVFFDVIHGNPHRTEENVISMMLVQTPILGVIAAIGSILVFTLPQVFQAVLVAVLHRTFRGRARFAVLLALPLTAVLTWYCYDYLTPSDFNLGINAGPDWTPYQHGISISRYMGALAFQAPITLFTFLFIDAGFRGASKWLILVAALVIAIVVGSMYGYVTAQGQIELLSSGQ